MNYLDKRKLIKSGYNLPILGIGAAPFMLSNDNINSNSSAKTCLLYTSPSPRDGLLSRMPSSA